LASETLRHAEVDVTKRRASDKMIDMASEALHLAKMDVSMRCARAGKKNPTIETGKLDVNMRWQPIVQIRPVDRVPPSFVTRCASDGKIIMASVAARPAEQDVCTRCAPPGLKIESSTVLSLPPEPYQPVRPPDGVRCPTSRKKAEVANMSLFSTRLLSISQRIPVQDATERRKTEDLSIAERHSRWRQPIVQLRLEDRVPPSFVTRCAFDKVEEKVITGSGTSVTADSSGIRYHKSNFL
jgi:hypothetical protein